MPATARRRTKREVIRFNPLGLNEGATPEAQLWVLMAQIQQELELRKRAEVLVTDRSVVDNFAYFLRVTDGTDPFGVEEARAQLRNAYAIVEEEMRSKIWAAGHTFTMADCAASPALFYANKVEPFGDKYPAVKRYHDRLLKRPSFARVIEEAQPYFKFFPYNNG